MRAIWLCGRGPSFSRFRPVKSSCRLALIGFVSTRLAAESKASSHVSLESLLSGSLPFGKHAVLDGDFSLRIGRLLFLQKIRDEQIDQPVRKRHGVECPHAVLDFPHKQIEWRRLV